MVDDSKKELSGHALDSSHFHIDIIMMWINIEIWTKFFSSSELHLNILNPIENVKSFAMNFLFARHSHFHVYPVFFSSSITRISYQ